MSNPDPSPNCTPLCRAAIAAASLLSVTPGALAAREAPADRDLETVTVYARRVLPLTEVAAMVTVVDQERIEATQAGDIQELVRYEPGLTVRSDPFRFGLDTVSIRGLGGNRVAVEVDGIPAATGFAVGSYADSGRAYVDPAFLRRVEFLRGPASSLYGSDAIGGVVAMTTLAPRDVWSNGDARTGADARTSVGYSSDDAGWNASALVAGSAGPAEWLVGYVRREGSEVDTAADVEPDPRDYASDAALVKFVLPGLGARPLTLTYEGSRVSQVTDVDAFLGVGRFAATTALAGDDRMLRERASVEQSLGAAGPAFDSANVRLYWQATQTDQDTVEQRRAVPPRTPAVQLDRGFDFDDSTLGLEFTAVRDVSAGRASHGIVYGFEASRTRLEELRNGLQTMLATGAATPVILGETFPVRDMPVSDVTEVGLFVQDDVRLDASRWSVSPALRVDWYELDPTADTIYREDNPTSAPVGVHEFSIAPKLGVTYRLGATTSAYFQYAHGFRSPPPEDVNIGLELPLFKVRAVPNPDLEPESSDGYELGLRFAGPAVALTTSVFWTDYRDFIESKVNLGVDPATGTTLFQSQNVAEARIAGIEVSGTVDLGAWRNSLAGWSTRLAASWTDGDDLVRDVPLNSIDPPRAVVGARYEPTAGRWAAELVVTAVAAQREVDRSTADLYRTDGYATVDLLAQWRIAPRVRLDLGLFNLTDTAYIEWADVRGRTADDTLVPYYTRPGFNASATLRYDF